ncbi:DUF6063 family protein [Bacillus mobilis]|uniref:DUF6063 family protein n=1 Tax=Bacillus mobilis TaxID=2026190 RepID=UPI002E1C6103|nr:DUF6063 family protein [Bacillus mobilis]MED0951976.1 DUF6063 family protein [Bacillus mobilis]
MYWEVTEVEAAFELFLVFLRKGKIEKNEGDLYQLYDKEQVQDILHQLIEKKANMKIFEAKDGLYIVPNMDNEIFSYSNEELRIKMKLKNNRELYLAYFAMLAVVSKFYNSEDQTLSTRVYVTIEDVESTINYHIEQFEKSIKEFDDTEDLADFYDLDIDGIVKTWNGLRVYDEKAKNIELTEKNRIGFLLKVFRFMQEENLFIVREYKEIELTEKLKRIVTSYYFNSFRKEQLMNLLQKSDGRVGN